ncbi:asparagine synthase (glutamine-hydrolyzing) [Actinokineospora sp. HUAS TT18]|uniref:asparagine synthase (glutamine-hydrolyzing) n=1 Tax=Actinokineospora sp. HUAS TT18 TaxID=3447451 RepID=UPI003F51B894
MFSGCGIAGALVFDDAGGPVPTAADVARMTDALAHRGPDGEGLWSDRGVHFGHRRLSIVGLGDTGAQPMTRDHLTIVYNGELYNFRELREQLRGDFVFESGTDTEVLLRAWQKWGPAAVDRLRGMFAFALWDGRERTLSLVRDRLGVKPLYFHRSDSAIVFASEVDALLRCPTVPRAPDLDAIRHRLLCSSTLEVDPWRTVVSGVRALPPATRLTVRSDGRTSSTTYWRLPEAGDDSGTELLPLLSDSVRTMLMADVPVSAFLSGGLDSSAITALARQSGDVTAVTVAYADEHGADPGVNDDLRFSQALVEHLGAGVDHHTFVQPNAVTLADVDAVCDMAALNDDVRHVNILANYRSVRDLGLTVVLNGQGADETMGGYVGRPNFIANIMDIGAPDDTRVNRLPSSRSAGGLSAEVLRYRGGADRDVLDFLKSLPGTGVERAHRLLVHTQLARVVQFEDFLAMRMSIEARFPFLDHPVVEWCFARPFERHLRADTRQGKVALREAMRGLLPDTVLDRPKAVFPYPELGALHRSLGELAADHEPELHADPLVASLFALPDKGEIKSLPVDSLWLVLATWRWHSRLQHA